MTDQRGRLMDVATIQRELDITAHVYVIDCDHGTKVGMTRQTVAERLDDLARGAGLVDITLVTSWGFETWGDARRVEAGAHWLLRDTRTVGEWFHCHPLDAVEAVERCIRFGPPLESWMDSESAAGVRAYLARREQERAA